jgi:hypothetical protein
VDRLLIAGRMLISSSSSGKYLRAWSMKDGNLLWEVNTAGLEPLFTTFFCSQSKHQATTHDPPCARVTHLRHPGVTTRAGRVV